MAKNSYLIVGRGRVGQHMAHYMKGLNITFKTWDRTKSLNDLKRYLASSTHVLLLISDHAIESFAEEHCANYQGLLLHCSGSLVSKKVFGAHWLSTFNHQCYALKTYQNIPFVIDHDAPSFKKLLPHFSNPHIRLHTSLKPKYHALCVLGGNFSCLLWQKLFKTFHEELNLPPSIAIPYLQQQTENLILHPEQALTGPLVRKDTTTLEQNLAALQDDPYQMIYKTFVECYQKLQETLT